MIIYHLDKVLFERNMKPSDLLTLIKANRTTIYGMVKNKPNITVTTKTLEKMCSVLDCDLHDLIEYIPDEEEK